MGTQQSTLAKNGYVVEEIQTVVVATKGDEKFLIKEVFEDEISRNAELKSEVEILRISHPHIVNSKNSFTEHETHYIVTDYCQGGSLAAKIKDRTEPPRESEVMSWIIEICMALRNIHEKGLLQKHLTPEDIHFTEFGILCLGGFQKVYENSKSATKKNAIERAISYLPPEVYTEGTYDVKSDIWSVGCILYELCTQQPAFSANSTIKLMPKILGGPYPTLPETFSPELCQLLIDIFNKDPESRPTTSEILGRPFIISCLTKMTKATMDEVQTKVNALWTLADGLERVHKGTTIGSLTGGVIGAVGGITSIVGLVLAPFTLGASLIVTGVGVGVGAFGGVTAGASNIVNMVNQSTDRKTVRNFIKDIEQKINAVATWLQEISNSLETIRSKCKTTPQDGDLNSQNLVRLGLRAGRGLGGIAELTRLVQVVSIGRTAAQVSRVVRVAEVATGVLSGLFVAVDMFFIVMDAKEIHNIRQAEAANEGTRCRLVSETDADAPDSTPVKSEIMKFAQAVREAAENLQKVVDELKAIIENIPSPEYDSDLEWQDME